MSDKQLYDLTPAEIEGMRWLQKVTFPMGSPPKRFVRSLSDATQMTEKQYLWIPVLVWRYRRQIGPNRATRIVREIGEQRKTAA